MPCVRIISSAILNPLLRPNVNIPVREYSIIPTIQTRIYKKQVLKHLLKKYTDKICNQTKKISSYTRQ